MRVFCRITRTLKATKSLWLLVTPTVVDFLKELHSIGIDLFLLKQGLDTTTPAGKAMFQMMGVFAEFERAIIQERVRAGLARVRSEGKKLGSPRIDPALEVAIGKRLTDHQQAFARRR